MSPLSTAQAYDDLMLPAATSPGGKLVAEVAGVWYQVAAISQEPDEDGDTWVTLEPLDDGIPD